MGTKSIKVFKLILSMFFILATFNIHAETIDDAEPTTTHNLTTTQQRPISDTKIIQAKPVKKSKAQSNSLGVFKLLIPNTLK
jgi:hypothetical protein